MQTLDKLTDYCARYIADKGPLRRFVGAYLDAIQFTDGLHAEDGDELAGLDLTGEGAGAWGEGELERIVRDCDAFMRQARDVIAARLGIGELWVDGAPYTLEQAAHDFWLTRNGHGAGFWDRQFTYGEGGYEVEGLGDALSSLCGHGTEFPPLDAYRGDDGRAYLA